jgi:hypothetical protein
LSKTTDLSKVYTRTLYCKGSCNNKIEKKGDLNSPISPIYKISFFGKGFKNDSTTDREIENEFDKFRYLQET